MSQVRLTKLISKRQKVELQIQILNSETGLKELELKEICKEINQIKNKNMGLMNRE